VSRREQVVFYSEGDEVACTILIPDDLAAGEKRPGVIFCTGYSGCKEMRYGASEDLNAAGYVALVFDYRGGVGDSLFRGKKTPKGVHTVFPEAGVNDLRAAIAYFFSRPEVDADRVGLMGTSFGGSVVVAAAAAEPRIACVVSEGGIGDGHRMVRGARTPLEFRQFMKKIVEDRIRRATTGKSESYPVVGLLGGRDGLLMHTPQEWESWEKASRFFPKIDWLERNTTLEVCDSWLTFRPELVVDKISPRPILFLGEETSVLVPPEEVPLMYEKAKETKKLIMYSSSLMPSRYAKLQWDKGASYAPVYWKPIIEWFKKYIPARDY
jgi:dienelactone hydrolase